MKKTAENDKRSRWKTGGAIAALLAAVAVFCVMVQMEKNALRDFETGQIYVVTQQSPQGKILNAGNCDGFITCMDRKLSDIPKNAITDKNMIDGLAAKFPIGEGVGLTTDMFESEPVARKELKDPVIAGFKAEDLYQVVGGVLRAGDRIHIYRLSEDGELSSVWENVYVQSVFEQAGTAIDNENKTACAQRINIYLNKQDVEEFYESLAEGGLRVVKVCK